MKDNDPGHPASSFGKGHYQVQLKVKYEKDVSDVIRADTEILIQGCHG